MIVHSFPFVHEDENIWYNVFIEPLDADEKVLYLVGITKPGKGIPPKKIKGNRTHRRDNLTVRTRSIAASIAHIYSRCNAGRNIGNAVFNF